MHLRQHVFVKRRAVSTALGDDGGLQPKAERIAASHQRGAGRRAHGLGVRPIEPRALGGKLVDVGRLDVGAAIADILPALVIGNDVDDVRRLALGRRCR